MCFEVDGPLGNNQIYFEWSLCIYVIVNPSHDFFHVAIVSVNLFPLHCAHELYFERKINHLSASETRCQTGFISVQKISEVRTSATVDQITVYFTVVRSRPEWVHVRIRVGWKLISRQLVPELAIRIAVSSLRTLSHRLTMRACELKVHRSEL